MTGWKFALPSEAQWEYVARAGTTTAWYCGDSKTDLEKFGWSNENFDDRSHAVGQLQPNAFGLYDMHGNVWEWCADWYDSGYYDKAPVDDPSRDSGGTYRVLRGGGWTVEKRRCRSANRNFNYPTSPGDNAGFRLALEIAIRPASLSGRSRTRPSEFMMTFEDITHYLSQAETYPEGGPVERIETHISTVFLTPTHAYKLLKPVDFGFLDFSTRPARYVKCWNEVRLNRRLAEDVYLDVVPLTCDAHGQNIELAGNGQPVDWVIRMRRLPAEATLQAKIESDVATTADIDQLFDVLCPFFREAATGPSIAADERPDVIRINVEENLETLARHAARERLSDAQVARLRSSQLQLLTTRRELFINGRQTAGCATGMATCELSISI
jgi:hypothetical protein